MKEVAHPRWVSTKAHSDGMPLPSDYTKTVIEYVQPAGGPSKGWASGITESGRESTKTVDVNTASVLLEIAYFQLRGGKPIVQEAPLLP